MKHIELSHFEPDLDNLPQQTLLQLLRETNQSLFLTGKAGTGKSTLLRYIHQETKKRHVLLASTGIAALNIGGQTIHSFFKLPLRPLLPDDPDLSTSRNRIYEVFKYTQEHKQLIRNLELIIIDEVSMVRADVIDAIDCLLRVFRAKRYEAFGGVQMLFVGDLLQLEPVVRGDEKSILDRYYRTPYFFAARVFETDPLVNISLEKVYRQDDPDFVAILDRVRVGDVTPTDLQRLNARVSPEPRVGAGEYIITLGITRAQVASINEGRLAELTAELQVISGIVEGDFPQAMRPTDERLELKVGAQVMMLTNDQERRWANGTIATVENIVQDEEGEPNIFVRLSDGQVHSVGMKTWENKSFAYDEEEGKVVEELLGSFTQYPLQLAWAITTHKSQGLTFDHVVIDLDRGAFAAGQCYVALSRCRSLEGIYLKAPIHYRSIIARQEVLLFYSSMNSPQIIRGALERAEALRGYIQATRAWNASRHGEAIEALASAIEQSNVLSNPLYLRLLKQKLYKVDRLEAELREMRRELEEGRTQLRRLAKEHVLMGDECLELASDARAALRCYQKALGFDPRSIDALIGESRAYEKLRERSKALRSLRQALRLSPLHYDALRSLGSLMLRLHMWQDALEPLLKALAQEASAEDVELLEELSQVYDRLEDEEKSALFMAQAEELRKRLSQDRKRKK